MSGKSASGGIGIPTVVLIVFIVLKLTGNIDWSWWWVLSPLWISVGLFLIILIVGALILHHTNKKKEKSHVYFESKEEDIESEFDEF